MAEDVPPCGYKTYAIVKAPEKPLFRTTLRCKGTRLENEYFSIHVDEERGASLRLLDKRTRLVYKGLNLFEDGGDRGDEYNYLPPIRDRVLTTEDTRARTRLIEKGPVRATIRAEVNLTLPRALSEDREERAPEPVSCPLTLLASIYPRIPRVDLRVAIENRAKDHRLRVIFPTGLEDADHAYAHDRFYVMKRPINPPKGEGWIERPSATYPQRFFVDVNDGVVGLMVANKGLPEYEVRRDGEAVLMLTLMRCVGWLFRIETVGPVIRLPPELLPRIEAVAPPVVIPTPEARYQGRHVFEYSIIPHEGNWLTSGAYKEAYGFNVPLLAHETAVHEGNLPAAASFVRVKPDTLIVTAVKRAETEDALVVRFYNVTGKTVQGETEALKPLEGAWIADLDEQAIRRVTLKNGRIVAHDVAPHRIMTLKLKLKNNS